jgi:hypothetical protein
VWQIESHLGWVLVVRLDCRPQFLIVQVHCHDQGAAKLIRLGSEVATFLWGVG